MGGAWGMVSAHLLPLNRLGRWEGAMFVLQQNTLLPFKISYTQLHKTMTHTRGRQFWCECGQEYHGFHNSYNG